MQLHRPNLKQHIALAYSSFTNDTYQDTAYQEILEKIDDNNFNMTYTYAIYTDHFMVKENIFLPIFHTYYLNSSPKLVILRNKECYDLPIVYPYHKYYIYDSYDTSQDDCEKIKQLAKTDHVYVINSLKDII